MAKPEPADERGKPVPRALHIAVIVLLVPATALSCLFLYWMADPRPGQTSGDAFSGGAPVFFLTAVLAWLVKNKPRQDD
jgi:hypothetical protein